jgi:hypothetical protein
MTVGRIPVIEGGIQPTIFDAKGDLLTATANDTPARLAVGANDTIVMADSTTATGLKYAGTYTTWTPTVTSNTGTITSSSVQGFRYLKIGKMVHLVGKVNIINKGTGAGSINVTLPFTAASGVDQVGTAEEISVVGLPAFCLISSGSANMQLLQTNYTTLVQDNYGTSFSITYEVA